VRSFGRSLFGYFLGLQKVSESRAIHRTLVFYPQATLRSPGGYEDSALRALHPIAM